MSPWKRTNNERGSAFTLALALLILASGGAEGQETETVQKPPSRAWKYDVDIPRPPRRPVINTGSQGRNPR